ncbi:MAG: FAD-dependent oxidoreductase, partial [Spirochaetes bacterium]|nr:FAD-dependent oxidoreductase [Spirochaetota bacterium]
PGAASAASADPSASPTVPGTPDSLEIDAVLVAVGRVPNSENLGLEQLGIRSHHGFVETGAWCQTAAQGIYAIGDLVNTPLLAHVASKEGELAAEHIAHVLKGTALPAMSNIQRDTVPSAIYCKPEVGSFGFTEEQAKAAGHKVSSFSFPYRGIGKAVATEKADGFIKLTADAETGELLGAAIAGEQATELIHELLLARQNELTIEEIADLMHAHPTLSEGVMEAARGVLGRAIHV